MRASREWTKYTGSVMAMDPSGRGKDETGYAVIKHLHGRFYLLDRGGFRGGCCESVLAALANIAKDYEVNSVAAKLDFGGGMLNELLEPVLDKAAYPVKVIDAERPLAQKERHIIDPLEPVLNQHKLVVHKAPVLKNCQSTENLPSEEVNRYRLFYQLARFTKDKGSLVSDDRIGA